MGQKRKLAGPALMTGTILPLVHADGSRVQRAPQDGVAALERREAERAIAYWRQKAARLGQSPTVAELKLNISELASGDWAYRFLIAADAVVDNHVLLAYGARFARLLDLPEKADFHVPMIRQIPVRYRGVFARGCSEASFHQGAVRMDGAVAREDGRAELFRAVFIPLPVRPGSLTHLVFGAFNCRLAESDTAAHPLRVSVGAILDEAEASGAGARMEGWPMALDS